MEIATLVYFCSLTCDIKALTVGLKEIHIAAESKAWKNNLFYQNYKKSDNVYLKRPILEFIFK